MKSVALALLVGAACAGANAEVAEDRTITKVVKMLQSMLDKSKADSDADRTVYAKFKCYCDTTEAEKTQSVDTLAQQIAQLENSIESLQGANGKLSAETAALSASMAENEAARTEASEMRAKESKAFTAEEADLSSAIGQMGQAIDVLATIGGDQTLQASAEHDKFMAGYTNKGSFVKLRSSVKQALLAAQTFLAPKQLKKFNSFLQSPFTGNYASQSGEIVGILKQMKETFESNLASAHSVEAKAKEANTAFMATKTEEFDTMKASFDEKQATMGTNDGELSTKKAQHENSVQQHADDQAFLQNLVPMCSEKGKEFDARKQLRANEEAAIAKAIAILNSDAAFETFGKVAATSSGATSLLATGLRRSHPAADVRRSKAEAVLRRALAAGGGGKRERLAHVTALLATGNPFSRVLTEITKMEALHAKDAEKDQEQLDWCNSERNSNNDNLAEKTTQVEELNTAITDLGNSIDDPATGLKKQISDTEASLVQNGESQVGETKSRRDENMVYQKSVGDAVEADALLDKAISLLKKYYATLEEVRPEDAGLVQKRKEDPAPPATWEDGQQAGGGGYAGQSGQGNSVIEMLEFIQGETQKEINTAHKDEAAAQAAFEDSMAVLKQDESDFQGTLASLHQSVAEAEKDLLNKKEMLEQTEKEKMSIEHYLGEIKAGCDWITTNFEPRATNRAAELEALATATRMLKETPAFQAAEASAAEDALGECKDKCVGNLEHVDCKACQASVSVPGYCAGHPSTAGC